MRVTGIAAALFALALFLPVLPAGAGQMEQLPDSIFEVWLTDASGAVSEVFESKSNMVVNVRFALANSELVEYPVNVTIEIGEGDKKESVESFSGRLDEGIYLFTETIQVNRNWGKEVPIKVIHRARIADRKDEGVHHFYRYRVAEGIFRIGYR